MCRFLREIRYSLVENLGLGREGEISARKMGEHKKISDSEKRNYRSQIGSQSR